MGQSSDMDQSPMALSVSLPSGLLVGEATFSNELSNDWIAVSRFLRDGLAVDETAILRPSRSISSGLLTAVASLSILVTRLAFLEFSQGNSKTKLKEGRRIQEKNNTAQN